VSSILAFAQEALPTVRYFPNDTKLALGMSLLELHSLFLARLRFCVHYCIDRDAVQKKKGWLDCLPKN